MDLVSEINVYIYILERKRRSSSPNLDCDKTLALKSSQMYKCGEEKSSIIYT